jgi:hypothetical protein
MKILGREPSLVISVIVALISLAGTLGYAFLSQDQAGLWITAVNGVAAIAMVVTVRPIQPGIYTYAIGALVALAAGYGLHVGAETVNGINMAVVPILALLTRGQVSPIESLVTGKSENPTPEAAAHKKG